jgi:starvation-inducible DNA-binding protein
VRGTTFFSLHELFDRIAKRLRKQADKLAERAAALGGVVEGSLRGAARNSTITEYDARGAGAYGHVAALADRMNAHAQLLRDAIRRAEGAGDPVTEHLLADLCFRVEQDLWFLWAHLSRRAGQAPQVTKEAAIEDAGEETLPT